MPNMLKRFTVLFLSLGLLLAGGQAAADTPSNVEHISQFDVDITLSKENIAQVQEKIVYDFGANYKHGMYRDIPVDYTDGSNRYYMQFTYGGTTDEQGQTVQAQQSTQAGSTRLRLGDPNQTITGAHTYNISYRLGPILYQKNGQLFLNYDVIGTGFTVPIDNAKITFRTADGTPLNSLTCFQGGQGSSKSCTVEQAIPGVATATITGLQAGQGASLNAYLPSSYTGNLLVANKHRPFNWSSLLSIIGGLFWFLVVAGIIAFLGLVGLLRYLRARRLRKQQTVVPQYDPPATMTPAEIGLLEDDSSDTAEITATIVDMARRGHYKIVESAPKTGLSKMLSGGKPDYDFIKPATPPADQLSVAELILSSAIFDGNTAATLSTIDKQKMATAVQAFKDTTQDSLVEKGYYERKRQIISIYDLTPAGAQEWALVDGFKLYITVVEKDRLAFTDAPSKTPERFSKLLPYAIALGVEKEWAKVFHGIDIAPVTGWYQGNMAAFTAGSFVGAFNDSIAAAVSSNNSSFSSGGGFSGGGFSGGGGGSW